MAKIFIIIAFLLQLCTTKQGPFPCTEYYSYTHKPGTNEILGQIKIPSPPKNVRYILRIGFNTYPLIHKNEPVARLEIGQPVEEDNQTVQQDRPLLYHVHFPLGQAIPRLTKIWFNNEQLCPNSAETENFATTVVVNASGEVLPSLNSPSHHDSSVIENSSPTANLSRDDNDLIDEFLTIQTQKPAQYNNECGINSYNTNRTNPLINYGEETMPGQWPWLVALFVVRRDHKFTCGGTVLTKRHVITAAHCLKLSSNDSIVDDTVHPNVLEVALGRFRLRQWRERGTVNKEVASFKIHPDYVHDQPSGDSDLAILTLRTPVEFSPFIRPICLWLGSNNLENIVNRIGWVVGWGQDELGHAYTELPRVARVPIVSQETCLRSHQGFYAITSNRTFCAGLRDNSGPCNGDGGSGLVVFDSTTGRYYLRGIVSGSFTSITSSCDLSNYVVYVDVAKYTSWIQEQISTTTPTNMYNNIFLRPTPAQPVPQPIPQPAPQPALQSAPQPTPQLAPQPDNNNNNNNNNNDNNYNECGISGRSGGTNLLIANGQKTLPGQWPWLAALFVVRNGYEFQCGSSVLTTRHVLTAAHCLKLSFTSNDTLHPNVLEVALGQFNLSRFPEEGTVNRKVASYKIHPEYAHTINGDSDLAILILKTPVEFSRSIRPICLWSGSTDLQNVIARTGYVVGWGERGHRYTEEPRMAMMPIVSLENCHWSHKGFVSLTSNRTFCAGMQDGTGPCNGDSGSGLVLFDATTDRYQLRGVVSLSVLNNELLCDLTKFVVFVDVAKYQFWILQQIST